MNDESVELFGLVLIESSVQKLQSCSWTAWWMYLARRINKEEASVTNDCGVPVTYLQLVQHQP